MDKNKKKNKIIPIICIILAVLLLAGVGVLIWVNSVLNNIKRFDGTEPTLAPEEIESFVDVTDTEPSVEQAEIIPTGKDIINVLIVGQDRREGEPRMHSDAMILCTLNKNTKTLTMTSFMRDMWVYIPDHYNERINVPYMVGGFELLNKTLEYNFGVKADYNVEVDFSGFMTAIDMMGGIDLELTAAEAKYLNRRGNWDVEDNQDWTLTEGINHMNGSQALAYSRIRDIGDDFGRTARQRTVMTVLLEKAKTLDAKELYDLAMAMIPLITTDMTNPQIMGIVVEVIPLLTDLKVVSQRIPMDGEFAFAMKGLADVIVLSPDNFEENKKLLSDAMKKE